MATRAQVIELKTPSATYDIILERGVLQSLYPKLVKLAKGKSFRPFLITSPKIWRLWSKQTLASFPPGHTPEVLFIPPGESHKRLATVEKLAEQLATKGADRDSLLIAFGGGVVGDMTGFLAAIYMRGIPYVQLPTTLLAQVDSSIGGKTGVNLAAGKNLVGSFHHPQAVFVDVDLLATLPPAELRAGLQESIKAGIIRDRKLFAYMKKNALLALERNVAVLTRIIAASIQVKAEVVARDEQESGLRMILNFGHTIGHAIEAATDFKKLLHGEAVAWGSIAALHVGLARESISPNDFAAMSNLILAYGPLPSFNADPSHLVALTASDKKTRSGRRAFVLPTGIGSVEVVYDVTDAELQTATESLLRDMRALTSLTSRSRVDL